MSEGSKLSASSGLRFDRRAASISRSKHALSTTLAAAGITHVPRYQIGSSEEALQLASKCGYPAVLREDSGYSGRGIWVANSAEELRVSWVRQQNERTGADFLKMRSFLNASDDLFIIEPWLGGDEWSIDCVVGPAGTYLIRACEKVTTIVAGRPVTLGYRLTDSVDLWAELRQAVEQWTSVLFLAGQPSFACFDIRRHPNGDLVPLDFGVRLGGDCIPLLVRHAGQSRNAYAAALDAALTGDPRQMCTLWPGAAIVHAFARQAGTFVGLAVHGQGEVIDSRPVGSVVKQAEDSPVYRRVGTVLTHFSSRAEFLRACNASSDWIQVNMS